jgi:hypothetical protein
LGKTLDFWEVKMAIKEFQSQPGEMILYRTTRNHKWYIIAWKIVSGLIGFVILTIVLFSMLAGSTESAFTTFLPAWAAGLLTKFLFLGLVPLASTAWVVEDLANTIIGEFILTDQRIWMRGSPYVWSQISTPLEDISSLTWHRDAIFIKQKSTRKLQVHMFSEGKLFVEAYQQLVGKIK